MAALRSLLVPADGSPPSLAALAHAIALAEDLGSSVDVLHVVGPEAFSVGSTSPMAPEARRATDEALDAAFAEAAARLGSRVSRQTVSGDPLRTIVETARAGRYDLVVLGTHARSGRIRQLMGSVAEGVVRNAPCPVLTVREPGEDYQSFSERRHHRPTLAAQTPPAPR